MAICPDENYMACYIDKLLSKSEAGQLERHLLVCTRCQEIVEVARKVEDQEKGLNGS
ncbi:MAG: hypothetical protein NT014_00935 [Candidatus Omnitrophica bacterium]|nr:hypothetical protein [Candidatus Omnitrophota bacterium]